MRYVLAPKIQIHTRFGSDENMRNIFYFLFFNLNQTGYGSEFLEPKHSAIKISRRVDIRAEGAFSSKWARYHGEFCLCPVVFVELFEARLQKTLFEFLSNSKRFVMRNPELIGVYRWNPRPRLKIPLFTGEKVVTDTAF